MRMRKKKNLIPRMERCAACRVPDGFALKGRWRETLMAEAGELRLELGCGKGRFTVETARQNPDILFIAIEKVPDALVVAMERATALSLKNVFFVVGDAALLHQLLRPLAPQGAGQAPPDPPRLPDGLPAGAASGRAGPLQNR